VTFVTGMTAGKAFGDIFEYPGDGDRGGFLDLVRLAPIVGFF